MVLPDGCTATSAYFYKKEKTTSNPDVVLPITLCDGKLTLATGDYQVEDFLTLCDTTDVGDEYDYRPGDNPVVVFNQVWKEISKQISGNLYRVGYACEVVVPAKANSTEKVILPVELQITGSLTEKAFYSTIKVDNDAQDHRLQLVIKTPFEFTNYCRQSQMQHIDTLVEHQIEPDNWRDHTEPLRRNFGFINIVDGSNSFSIMPQGLHEHVTDGKSFALTLLRAIGNLGSTKAGPAIFTPEAQERGERIFSVAFSFDGDGSHTNSLWKQSNRLLNSACGVALHPDIETKPYSKCFYKLDSNELMISAFYFDKDLDKNIIRIFNPTCQTGFGSLSGECIPNEIQKISYSFGSVNSDTQTVNPSKLSLKAGEIATFVI